MKINAFDIQEFGILAKQSQYNLPSGLLIFLGQNEAGKSTSLEFFRTLLTGFPSARSKKSREGLFASKNPQMGGMLELSTKNAGLMKIERTKNAFNLYDAKGNSLDSAIYEALFAGVSREIYSSLYGFSLNEIQTLDALEAEEVKTVLYGTSFGLGLYSPQKAFAQIDAVIGAKNAKSLIKNDSIKNVFKTNAQRIEEINALIQEYTEKNNEIDTYYKEYDLIRNNLQSIRSRREDKYEEILAVQKKINAWEVYQDYYLTSEKIKRIPAINESLSFVSIESLAKLENEEYQIKSQGKNLEDKKQILLANLEKKELNAQLVEIFPKLKELVEYKASYRNAFIQIPYTQETINKTEEELAKEVKYLGNSWSLEKVRSIDYSFEVHKSIETFNVILSEAEGNLKQVESSISYLNQEKLLVTDEIKYLEKSISELKKEKIDLDPTKREQLTTALRRTQDAVEKMPEKLIHLKLAKADFTQALNQLSFKITPSEQILSKVSNAQNSLLALASKIAEQAQRADIAKENLKQAKKAVDKLEEQQDFLSKENQKLLHLERTTLYKKRNAVQRIKYLEQNQEQEVERILDLQGQYDEIAVQLPNKTSGILSFLFGVFAFCLGGILLITSLYYDIKEIDISFFAQSLFIQENLAEFIEIPNTYIIHSPFALLVFLIGFTCIYVNIPMYNPDRKKKLLMLAQINSRKEAAMQKLQANKDEFIRLCQFLEVKKVDNEILEELEIKFEHEQEQLISKENLLKETSQTENELRNARFELSHNYAKYQKEERAIQELRRVWQEQFANLSISDVPSADAVGVYFARIDQIRMAKQSLKNLEEEINALKNSKQTLSELALEVLPDIKDLSLSSDEIVRTVQDIINICNEQEKINERKLQLLENIDTLENKKLTIESNLANFDEKLKEKRSELEKAKDEWNKYLTSQLLDSSISPERAKAILAHVEKCRNIENNIKNLYKEKDLHQNEIDRLVTPLEKLLVEINRNPIKRLDNEPDYLSTLDILLSDAEKAKEILSAKITIEEQLSEINKEIDLLSEEKEKISKNIKKLLESLNLKSINDFKEMAIRFEEKNQLLEMLEQINDKLKLLSIDENIEEFVKGFEGVDLLDLQHKKRLLDKNLLEIQSIEEEINTNLAEKKAFIQQLEDSTLLTELKQEKANIEEQNKYALESYLAYSLARTCIQKTKQKYEEEKQPELIRTASEIFNHITDGKWLNISTSIEDSTLTLNPYRGLPVTPDKLSQGTREQLYLSLRLAYIKNAAKYKEALPLIMDDILVNFDTLRSTQTAKTLATFTEDSCQHQILFFTCHQHIANILKENVPNSTLFTIEKGKISRN